MSLTVLTANYHSSKYIRFQDFMMRRLAKDPTYKRIICNVTPGNQDLAGLAELPNTEIYAEDFSHLAGSESHGAAINSMIRRVTTEYAVIADPDTAMLIQDWDEICRRALTGKVAAVGTPYHVDTTIRFQNFPNVIFFFFRAKEVQALNIDFRPPPNWVRKIRHWTDWLVPRKEDPDVGYRVPREFKRAGLESRTFAHYVCSDPESVIFKPDARGAEFHWQGRPIVTHQGRSGVWKFDEHPVSKAWIDRVCTYARMPRYHA